MAFEIVRWITLAILWVCIIANWTLIILNARTRKELKASCDIMEKLISEWEEKHAMLNVEEDFDGRND